MEVTRQFWTVASVGAFLASWGVILVEPLALFGGGVVAAWLLGNQYRFVRAATRVRSALSVTLSTPQRVTAEETSQLSLEARVEHAPSLAVDVAVTPPVGASGDPATTTLTPGNEHALDHTALAWPVAGAFTVDDVTATFTDDAGLFRQSVDLEAGTTVQVNPRTPRDLHVGEGGDPIGTGFGEHESGRLGTGIEPAEVREYVPGDAVRQIDWKATARLDYPHVQEFEGGTDRETLLVFDHRAVMSEGRPGARKLDYARQLALAVVGRADELGDRLGYYGVGDEGLTVTISPGTRTDTWTPIRERLLAVSPTDAEGARDDPASSAAVETAAARLAADASAFGRTLTPFFEARGTYRRRFDSLPLYRAVTNADFSSSAMIRTVIVTDDSNRTELRETVKYARRKGGQVTVFVTPSVLFGTTDLTDLDRAYERYVDFEEFRRELAGLGRVDAFEVGPADRLSAVLSAGHDRRARGNA